MKISLPISLTLLRMFIIPLLIAIFYSPIWLVNADFSLVVQWSRPICALLFAIAAITDVLDGYIARRYGQVTRFGALIDPIADKLIIAVALILITEDANHWIVTLPAIVIVTREIAISGLREWMAALGHGGSMAVSWDGKVKTVLQMVAITLLLLEMPIANLPVWESGLLLLYIASVLTLWSMIRYLLRAKRLLN